MKVKGLPPVPRPIRGIFADLPSIFAVFFGGLFSALFAFIYFQGPYSAPARVGWTLFQVLALWLVGWGIRRLQILRRVLRHGVAVRGSIESRGRSEGIAFWARFTYSWRGASHRRKALCTFSETSSKMPNKGHAVILVDPDSGRSFPLSALLHLLDTPDARAASELRDNRDPVEMMVIQTLVLLFLGPLAILGGVAILRADSYDIGSRGRHYFITGLDKDIFGGILVLFGCLMIIVPFVQAKLTHDSRRRQGASGDKHSGS
jgi:hypothetical protein